MLPRWFLAVVTVALLSMPHTTAKAQGISNGATQAGAPSPIVVAPHRAIYKMSLASVKNGSNVAAASGQMAFEWADACDGWAVQQHMNLHFTYAEGDESDTNTTSVDWEAKNGDAYKFNTRRVTDGKETENYRGGATLTRNGGTGVYIQPKEKEIKLSSGTLFPSAHTILILQKAQTDERFFTRSVFDGSDEDGLADVSAFIGPRSEPSQNKPLSAELRNNPLLDKPSWPVRLAFFTPNSETGEPDYEMDMTLQSNGITRSMTIDYGDFTISGVLVSLEALPASGC